MLAELKPTSTGGKPRYLRLVNKFDYLTNGKSKTGYHTMQDLYHLMKEDEQQVVEVSFADALQAFKTTDSAEAFVRQALPDEEAIL